MGTYKTYVGSIFCVINLYIYIYTGIYKTTCYSDLYFLFHKAFIMMGLFWNDSSMKLSMNGKLITPVRITKSELFCLVFITDGYDVTNAWRNKDSNLVSNKFSPSRLVMAASINCQSASIINHAKMFNIV